MDNPDKIRLAIKEFNAAPSLKDRQSWLKAKALKRYVEIFGDIYSKFYSDNSTVLTAEAIADQLVEMAQNAFELLRKELLAISENEGMVKKDESFLIDYCRREMDVRIEASRNGHKPTNGALNGLTP